MTTIKRAILDFLSTKNCFTSRKQIFTHLQEQNLHPVRSTLLRELHFLENSGIIKKVHIAHQNYYELSSIEHQHLICLHCQRIQAVQLNLHSIQEQAARNDFHLNNSDLLLFGFCACCQKEMKR